MSVVISNVTPDGVSDYEPHSYVVRFNIGPVIARFDHVRMDGLAMCLYRAADAVRLADDKRREAERSRPSPTEEETGK